MRNIIIKKSLRTYLLISTITIFALSTYFLVKVENVGFFSNYMAVGTIVDQFSHKFEDPSMNTALKWVYYLMLVQIGLSLVNIVLSKKNKFEIIRSLIYSSLPIYYLFSSMFASKIYIFESRTTIIWLFYIVPSIVTFTCSSLITFELLKQKKIMYN